MPRIATLIDELRHRSDLTVEEEKESWLVRIPKGDGLVWEITVPIQVLEWFASVKKTSGSGQIGWIMLGMTTGRRISSKLRWLATSQRLSSA